MKSFFKQSFKFKYPKSLLLVSFFIGVFFQNCGRFEATSELPASSLSNEENSQNSEIRGWITNPITGIESEVVYVDDLVLPVKQKQTNGIKKNSNKSIGSYKSGIIYSNLIKWQNNTLYFLKNSYIPWESDVQFRKVMDGVIGACEKWKAVADIYCVEISNISFLPAGAVPIFVSLAQVQTIDQFGKPRFRDDGTPSNFCGMKYDHVTRDGNIISGTYSYSSCATVGLGIDDEEIDIKNITSFIAINPATVDDQFIYLHEVGHLLGLAHPHNRLDRDNFLNFNPKFPKNHPRYSDYSKIANLPGNGDDFDFASTMVYSYTNVAENRYLNIEFFIQDAISLLKDGVGRGDGDTNRLSFDAAMISSGAFAMRTELIEAKRPLNLSARQTGGAYPSPKDAAAVAELYGNPMIMKRSCQFNSTTMPHGTRLGVYETGEPKNGVGYCASVPVVCNDGTLSESSNRVTCSAHCTIAGKKLKLGERIDFFESASVAAGQTCVAKTEWCDTAKLNTSIVGSQTCGIVVVSPPVNCEGTWGTCQGTCGTGQQVFSIQKSAANGGTQCLYQDKQTQTCQLPACQAAAACTYTVSKSASRTPAVSTISIQPGETVYETIQCSNLPANAVVKMVGKLNGSDQINEPLSLTSSAFLSQATNDGIYPFGAYVRNVKIMQGTSELFSSPTVTVNFMTPFCTYTVRNSPSKSGVTDLTLQPGETVYESIQCSSLPANAIVKMVGKFNDAPQINEPLAMVNGSFSSQITNDNPALAGKFVRSVKIVLGSSELFSSPIVTVNIIKNGP